MANKIYPKYKQALLSAAASVSLNAADGSGDGVFVALVETGVYTYSDAHEFYSEVTGVVGTPVEINNKTLLNGVFDGDNVVFPSLVGNDVGALVIFRRNAGVASTWRLVAYIDTGVTGFPFTPSASDFELKFNALGIFSL